MGGHGGLNILPQKSWNPYGRKQRARVRRDEEQVEREKFERERKLEVLEKELTLRKLRKSGDDEDARGGRESRIRGDDDDSVGVGEDAQANKEARENDKHEHVNFFEEHERALASLERKQRDKKGSEDEANRLAGARVNEPWYAKSHQSFYNNEGDDDDDAGEKRLSLPARVRKEREETERLRLGDKKTAFENRPTLSKVMLTDGYVPPNNNNNRKVKGEFVTTTTTKAEKRRKNKKEKKKKKEKKDSFSKKSHRKRSRSNSGCDDESESDSEDEETKRAKLQKLREERTKRETTERERTNKLIAKSTNPFL
jgi:hypothetical protein